MRVSTTEVDPTYKKESGKPPVYVNKNSHWWDGSQIYGSDRPTMDRLRSGKDGKLRVNVDGRLPLNPETGIDDTGFVDNWWTGLSLLHTLFTLEHNAICDGLKKHHPDWTDEHLWVKARLINAALMAKIHTVEWTPAILPNPTTQMAMRVNWRGVAPHLQKVFKGLDDSELYGGIVGSKADHHTAPYALTEEFVSVYRMHGLMPDEFTFQEMGGGRSETFELPQIFGRKARPVLEQWKMADLFYSFGRMHPGMIRLHNYPKHLQTLTDDKGQTMDLCVIDILRDRERGVPRYNQFRELLRLPRIEKFEDITDNPEWAAQIKEVYNGNIDDVDLQVGLQCEPLPDGFGFSETAFRIFVLMASRRLKSDRFFTDDYGPELYTKFGIDWVEKTTMIDIILRHYPQLKPALSGVKNAFNPWREM